MRVTIRVSPGASRTRVGGQYGQAEQLALRVFVSARAVDGRATASALRAVADAFGVRDRAVTLVTGATSRTKVVAIDGDEASLQTRLAALLQA